MNQQAVIDLTLQALLVSAKLAAPVLVTSLVVGFAISLFQSVTQIQEVTLSSCRRPSRSPSPWSSAATG